MKTTTLIFLFITNIAFAETYYYSCNTFNEKIDSAIERSKLNLKFYQGANCTQKLEALQNQNYLVDLLTSYSATVCPFQNPADLQTQKELLELMEENGPSAMARNFDQQTLELSNAGQAFYALFNDEYCENTNTILNASDELVAKIDKAIVLAKKLNDLDCPNLEMPSEINKLIQYKEKIMKKTASQLSQCE